jgi:hypothetical protein
MEVSLMTSDTFKERIENDVVAVMRSQHDIEEAVSDLERQGFEREGIRVYHPGDAPERLDAMGHQSGIIRKVIKHFEGHLSDQNLLLEEYEEASRSGLDIIAVRVHKPEQADLARDVLQNHNAENIRHFGPWAVTDLENQGRATGG